MLSRSHGSRRFSAAHPCPAHARRARRGFARACDRRTRGRGTAGAYPPLLCPRFLLDPRPARRHPVNAGHARGAGPLPGRVPGRQAPRHPGLPGAAARAVPGKIPHDAVRRHHRHRQPRPGTGRPPPGRAVSPHPRGRLRHQRSRLHPGRRGRPVQHHRKPGAHGHAHCRPAPEPGHPQNLRAGRQHPERPVHPPAFPRTGAPPGRSGGHRGAAGADPGPVGALRPRTHAG